MNLHGFVTVAAVLSIGSGAVAGRTQLQSTQTPSLQGHRKHRRGGELRVRCTLMSMICTLRRQRAGLALVMVVCLVAVVSLRAFQSVVPPKPGQPGKDVVWVPTPAELVEKMLDMAGVSPNDFVIDLGSGDGRNVIAAAKRGARALGVEYNPDLVALSQQRAADAHVSDKATFVQGDMYAADVSQATVLALFLTPEVLDRMTDKFLAMKPGARIVLNTFPVTDWEPDATETIAPCKAWCTALLVIVPARVGGTWQWGNTQMTLRQDYQFVRGTLGAQPVTGRLRGAHITLKSANTEYSGEVFADRIEGTATAEGSQTPWIAVRSQPRP